MIRRLINFVTRRRFKIFISYRRSDTGGRAGRLNADLARHFGAKNIFFDIANINAGDNFVKSIDMSISQCQVLLAVIGDQWLSSLNKQEHQSSFNQDYVRHEITSALARDVKVIPVLVQETSMPNSSALPKDMQSITSKEPSRLSDKHWSRDVKELVRKLQPISKWQMFIITVFIVFLSLGAWKAMAIISPATFDEDGRKLVDCANKVADEIQQLVEKGKANNGKPEGDAEVKKVKDILAKLDINISANATPNQIFDFLQKEQLKASSDLSYLPKLARAMGIECAWKYRGENNK